MKPGLKHIHPATGEEILYKADISRVAYGIALIMFLVLMATGQLSGLLTTELVITPKRVTGKRGLIWRRTINIAHKDIKYVSVRQGILGTIFDYGTIKIITQDNSKVKFKGIAVPLYVKQQLEEINETAVLGYSLAEYTVHRF